ncbi:MAG: hypothetical protein ACREX8_00965 [Gammaproteobacteria bacterium]
MTASPPRVPIQSLTTGEATGIDARTAWSHILAGDPWRLRRLGARDLIYNERAGYVQFDFRLTRKLRVVVKLCADDTYAVELGRCRKRRGSALREYEVLEQTHLLDVEQVGQAVEHMCVAWS